MKDILEKLKQYFKDTPREEVLKAWKEAKENAPKNSPPAPINMEIAPNLKKILEAHEYYLGLLSNSELFMIPKDKFGTPFKDFVREKG